MQTTEQDIKQPDSNPNNIQKDIIELMKTVNHKDVLRSLQAAAVKENQQRSVKKRKDTTRSFESYKAALDPIKPLILDLNDGGWSVLAIHKLLGKGISKKDGTTIEIKIPYSRLQQYIKLLNSEQSKNTNDIN